MTETAGGHNRMKNWKVRKIIVPLLVIWGARSHTEGVHGDVLAVWQRDYATDASGGALPCGHYVPEEAPDETNAHFMRHFKG